MENTNTTATTNEPEKKKRKKLTPEEKEAREQKRIDNAKREIMRGHSIIAKERARKEALKKHIFHVLGEIYYNIAIESLTEKKVSIETALNEMMPSLEIKDPNNEKEKKLHAAREKDRTALAEFLKEDGTSKDEKKALKKAEKEAQRKRIEESVAAARERRKAAIAAAAAKKAKEEAKTATSPISDSRQTEDAAKAAKAPEGQEAAKPSIFTQIGVPKQQEIERTMEMSVE